jgi:hypothetical protein
VSVVGIQCFEVAADGRVKVGSVSQTDIGLKGASLMAFKAMAPGFIASTLKTWHKKHLEFLQS